MRRPRAVIDAIVARVGVSRAFWLVATIALALRVAWVIVGHKEAIGGDPQSYVFYGDRLSRGDGYDSYREYLLQQAGVLPEGELSPTAFYAVGYPLILAGLFAVARMFGAAGTLASYAWIYGMFQAVLGALTVYFVARIAARLVGNRVGLIAGVFFAVWPNVIVYTATAHVETVYLFLLTGAVLVVLPAVERGSSIPWRRLVAAGAILGVAAQVRPLVIFLLPGVLLAFRRKPEPWTRALVHTGIVAALMLALVLPWTIRNAVVMPGFVLVTTGSGDAFCMTRYEGSDGRFVFDSPGCLNDVPDRPFDEVEVIKNRENTSRAATWIVHHPLEELRLWLSRASWAFRDDHEARLALQMTDDRRAADLVPDAWYYAMLALAAVGVRPLLRGRRGGPVLAASGVFAGAVVPIALFGDPRYKVPMLPFVAILAAVGVSRLASLEMSSR